MTGVTGSSGGSAAVQNPAFSPGQGGKGGPPGTNLAHGRRWGGCWRTGRGCMG